MMATEIKQYAPRLKRLYSAELRPALLKELGLKNIHQVPRLEKIVLNVGLGRVKEDNRARELAVNTLRKITGQQPVETTAKQSIAAFKLREGQKIGAKVTLRGDRMYEFLDRLVSVVLPRVRDFRGLPRRGFDPRGNYNLGVLEQSVFPELEFEDIVLLHGLQITFVIEHGTPGSSQALLSGLGMPFEHPSKGKGD